MKILSRLTNKKPVKNQGFNLTVSTTKGNIKISSKASSAMGLSEGDYLDIIEAENEAGEKMVFIGRGSFDTETGEKIGSKLATVGSSLQCSAALAYQSLEGNDEENRIYTIQGLEEGEEDMVESDENGNNFYPIVFKKAVAKLQRGTTATAGGGDEEEEEDLD